MNEPQHWAQAYAATAQPTHACLPPEALLLAWDEGATAAQREAAVTAMAECAQCAAIAQIARDLQQDMAAHAQDFAPWARPAVQEQDALARGSVVEIGTYSHAHATPRRARGAWRLLPWAAAAVVLLGVGMASWVLRAPGEAPAVRGEVPATITPASGSRLRAAPASLHWAAIGTASVYRVELYDETAQSLWRSERIAGTAVDLPDALRAQLRQGTYLWRVRAEGSEVETGPFYFRVEP